MEIQFVTSKKVLEKAAGLHFDYRFKYLRFVLPLIGGAFLVYGAFVIFGASGIIEYAIGGGLIGMGLSLLFRRFNYVKKAAEKAFKGRPDQIPIEVKVSEEGLEIKNEFGSGNFTWSSFVDCKICSEGILLYPHPNVFYWIPADSRLVDGGWRDLETLITTNVIRKV